MSIMFETHYPPNQIWFFYDQSGTPHITAPTPLREHTSKGHELGWGYYDSASADTALNILDWRLQVLRAPFQTLHSCNGNQQACFQAAYDLHQTFRNEFIAPLFLAGYLEKTAVDNWIVTRLKAYSEEVRNPTSGKYEPKMYANLTDTNRWPLYRPDYSKLDKYLEDWITAYGY